jgi:ADP-heptose:LPS heptosyltransferase
MKVGLMRALDAFVGVPACAVCSAAVGIKRLFARPSDKPGAKLLLIKLSELGANIMLGDMVRMLRATYSRENTWFMAFDESEAILRQMDFVPPENLLLVSTKGPGSFARSLLRALWRVRRAGVDTSIDLEFFSRASTLIALFTGARRRVGIHPYYGEGAYRGTLTTHGVKFNPHLHISQMFAIMAAAAAQPYGVLQRLDYIPPPVAPIKERFVPAEGEKASVQTLLESCGWQPGERVVLLNANTSDRELIPLRRWGEERYAEVARQLLAECPGVRVLLTGAPKEAAGIAELERRVGSPRCVSVAGRTSLRELFTLYCMSEVMVTNDSGPAHFAALTDMAVIVLFGPETPQLWKPLGKRVRVIYRGLGCSPCFSIYNGRRSGCRDNICMDIPPEVVTAAVKDVLAEPRRAPG